MRNAAGDGAGARRSITIGVAGQRASTRTRMTMLLMIMNKMMDASEAAASDA